MVLLHYKDLGEGKPAEGGRKRKKEEHQKGAQKGESTTEKPQQNQIEETVWFSLP